MARLSLQTTLTIVVVMGALASMGGCAQLKKNLSNPHPMEHQFGHVLFNDGTPANFPKLKPAAPTRVETPKGKKVAKTGAAETAQTSAKNAPVKQTARRPELREPTVISRAQTPTGKGELPTVPSRPKAPKPTRDQGLDITEVPDSKPPAQPATPGLGDGSLRSELLAAAKRLVGIGQNFDEEGFLTHLLQVSDYPLQAKPGDDLVKTLYNQLSERKATFGANQSPRVGDLVFFHNTYDRDKDSRADDWFTMVGVVESVDGSATITFIGFAQGGVRRLYLNTQRPAVRRNDASQKTLNSIVRAKSLADRPFTSYLSGELFASYGRLDATPGARQAASK